MTMQPKIVVLGSLNMDLLLRVPRAPEAGETLAGRSLELVPGGKGGNQAVSCARQGALVTMLGRVGDDAYGQALTSALAADGIETQTVGIDPQTPTGTALVMVDDAGQNRIVVIAGANGELAPNDAEFDAALGGADFVVMQLEVPLATVLRAIDAARRAGVNVMLNPSPVQALPDSIWPGIDTLIVNEGEAQTLSGRPVDSPAQAAHAARELLGRGVRRVVVTLGAQGAIAADRDGTHHHPAITVKPVDTTAAGDTFAGAMVTALAAGNALNEAVSRGTRAAALCVTQAGAQPSIPGTAAVDAMPEPPAWSAI